MTDDRANGGSYGSIAQQSASENAATTQEQTTAKPARALAPDLLRGILMVFMALDHVFAALCPSKHGTSPGAEADGAVVHGWSPPTIYIERILAHLCGPGFMLTMGMGIVFLHRSRARMGWSAGRVAGYFTIRAFILAGVAPVVMGLVTALGAFWYLNLALTALGFGLLAGGLICMALSYSEGPLADLVIKVIPSSFSPRPAGGLDASEPLLPPDEDRQTGKMDLARSITWHMQNALLLVLSLVTIWWNIWLSVTGGHCSSMSSDAVVASSSPASIWLRIWFWPISAESGVMSTFPPLAWISFCILGLLYGRILTARSWSSMALGAGYSTAFVVFGVFFVLTRLLQFGDLSKGCMQAPEHLAHPDMNPYLTSARAFFYTVKYPPDVSFWALTLAGNFLFLAVFEVLPRTIAGRLSILLDYGRSPFFFYVIHIFITVAISIPVLLIAGEESDAHNPLLPGKPAEVTSLPIIVSLWLIVLLVMWPLCRVYARFKARQPLDSIWRLF